MAKQQLTKIQREIKELNRTQQIKPSGWRGFYQPMSGASNGITNIDLYHGTSVQVCGLYPFATGSSTPLIGTPVGHNIFTGATVCCDPISWYARAKLINNPSMFVFGNPGLGKSTFVRRELIGAAAQGIHPLILGDIRPDYVDLVRELDGQVISLQEGVSYLNILDPGDASYGLKSIKTEIEMLKKNKTSSGMLNYARKRKLTDKSGNILIETGLIYEKYLEELNAALAEIKINTVGYQRNTLFMMIALLRGTNGPTVPEGNIISAALEELQRKFDDSEKPPILKDLYELVTKPTKAIRAAAMDRGSDDRYQDTSEELVAVLMSMISGGRFGTVFSKHTSEPMSIDKPVVFDISKINNTDKTMRAAILMACWTTGFGTVGIANLLAALGLEEQRHYLIAMDEMHQALGAGIGMVERIDYLTRLNRKEGVGQIMITHTPKDLFALPTEEERMKASGLVERSGLKVLGGLSKKDLDTLDTIIDLSETEKDLVNQWQSPAGLAKDATPPGQGNFLVKIGGRPGIPIHVSLTRTEIQGGVNATGAMWEHLNSKNSPNSPQIV